MDSFKTEFGLHCPIMQDVINLIQISHNVSVLGIIATIFAVEHLLGIAWSYLRKMIRDC